MHLSFWKGMSAGCATTGAVVALLWNRLSQNNNDKESSDTTRTVSSPRVSKISSLGTPTSSGVERVLANHVLHYTHDKRIPLWVQEHLSNDVLQKDNCSRESVKFNSDEAVGEPWRALNSDYHRSGWSRGHMTPAADNKNDLRAMEDSFLLSNIVPQDMDNNGDYWNRMEMFCRDRARHYRDVWITSGPAFVPHEEDGKKIVSYQVIGKNEVAVPTHLYKVIVTEDERGARSLAAFLVPNEPIKTDYSLKHFQIPLEDLEKRVGFRFFNNLDRATTADLCEVDGCNMMSRLELKQFVYVKRINRVKKREALDKLWEKIKDKGVPITQDMQAAYEKKLLQWPAEGVVGA